MAINPYTGSKDPLLKLEKRMKAILNQVKRYQRKMWNYRAQQRKWRFKMRKNLEQNVNEMQQMQTEDLEKRISELRISNSFRKIKHSPAVRAMRNETLRTWRIIDEKENLDELLYIFKRRLAITRLSPEPSYRDILPKKTKSKKTATIDERFSLTETNLGERKKKTKTGRKKQKKKQGKRKTTKSEAAINAAARRGVAKQKHRKKKQTKKKMNGTFPVSSTRPLGKLRGNKGGKKKQLRLQTDGKNKQSNAKKNRGAAEGVKKKGVKRKCKVAFGSIKPLSMRRGIDSKEAKQLNAKMKQDENKAKNKEEAGKALKRTPTTGSTTSEEEELNTQKKADVVLAIEKEAATAAGKVPSFGATGSSATHGGIGNGKDAFFDADRYLYENKMTNKEKGRAATENNLPRQAEQKQQQPSIGASTSPGARGDTPTIEGVQLHTKTDGKANKAMNKEEAADATDKRASIGSTLSLRPHRKSWNLKKKLANARTSWYGKNVAKKAKADRSSTSMSRSSWSGSRTSRRRSSQRKQSETGSKFALKDITSSTKRFEMAQRLWSQAKKENLEKEAAIEKGPEAQQQERLRSTSSEVKFKINLIKRLEQHLKEESEREEKLYREELARRQQANDRASTLRKSLVVQTERALRNSTNPVISSSSSTDSVLTAAEMAKEILRERKLKEQQLKAQRREMQMARELEEKRVSEIEQLKHEIEQRRLAEEQAAMEAEQEAARKEHMLREERAQELERAQQLARKAKEALAQQMALAEKAEQQRLAAHKLYLAEKQRANAAAAAARRTQMERAQLQQQVASQARITQAAMQLALAADLPLSGAYVPPPKTRTPPMPNCDDMTSSFDDCMEDTFGAVCNSNSISDSIKSVLKSESDNEELCGICAEFLKVLNN